MLLNSNDHYKEQFCWSGVIPPLDEARMTKPFRNHQCPFHFSDLHIVDLKQTDSHVVLQQMGLFTNSQELQFGTCGLMVSHVHVLRDKGNSCREKDPGRCYKHSSFCWFHHQLRASQILLLASHLHFKGSFCLLIFTTSRNSIFIHSLWGDKIIGGDLHELISKGTDVYQVYQLIIRILFQ